MKKLMFFIMSVLIIPAVFAVNLEIEKTSSNEVMILGLDQPAVFDLEIKNLGEIDNFQFYNLWGFDMVPKQTGEITRGETAHVKLEIYPREDFKINGYYTLPYSIKGSGADMQDEELTFKVVELEDAFSVGVESFDVEENKLLIYIQNKENFKFEDITAEFSSAFFKTEKKFSLEPNKKKSFEIILNKEDFSKLKAGYYTMKANVDIDGKEAEIEGTIDFKENKDVKTTEESHGIIINTKEIIKENKGNVVVNEQTIVTKNIISRLFASASPEPDLVERKGLKVSYIWERAIEPGQKLDIVVKTNWTLPLIILILIGVIIYLVKFYSNKDVVIRKRVNFVHSKSGELALKISISVHAKTYIEKVNVIDRLPLLTKLYHQFGGQQPSRVLEEKRRIEWSFNKLEEGEVRMFSYMIYSKVGVLGRFALPKTTSIYEKDGQLKEAQSNTVYFMAEQRGREEEE